MSRRTLASQGLEGSSIGLGCMEMRQSFSPADEGESIVTLQRTIDLGCTFFDTTPAMDRSPTRTYLAGICTGQPVTPSFFEGVKAQEVSMRSCNRWQNSEE